jgi:protein-disulfide isomerase
MAKDRVDAGRGRRADVVKKSKKAQSKTPFYALLAVVAVVGVAALAYVATRPKAVAKTVDPATVVAGEPQGYLLGKPDAPVQVIEFADFECPACGQFATLSEPDIRKRLIEPGTISYRFYDYPLSMHRNTWPASNAAACADEQGKFWEMHDVLFNAQDQWNGQATSRPKSKFKDYAKTIGLDVGKWEACYDAQKYQPRIKANEQMATKRGASQTPTFVIGNKMVGGAISYDNFKALVDSALVLAKADTAKKPAAGGDTAKKVAVPAKGPGGA